MVAKSWAGMVAVANDTLKSGDSGRMEPVALRPNILATQEKRRPEGRRCSLQTWRDAKP